MLSIRYTLNIKIKRQFESKQSEKDVPCREQALEGKNGYNNI